MLSYDERSTCFAVLCSFVGMFKIEGDRTSNVSVIANLKQQSVHSVLNLLPCTASVRTNDGQTKTHRTEHSQ